MQNYKRVTLISLFFLVIIVILKPEGPQVPLHLPQWLQGLHQNLLTHFTHPQNAHFLFAILTGDKKGLSGCLLKDMNTLNLRFLLSPTGLHLTGFLFFFKKGKNRIPIYLACWLLPGFYSLKRLALLRFMTLFKKGITQIDRFYLTFFISFCCGHFFKSPLGFTYSFLLIGTFFSLNQMSFIEAFLAIAASHLVISFFSGDDFSFLALVFTLVLVQCFSLLLPLFFFFVFSFYITPSHWIEPFIRFFIVLIHYAAKFSNGTFLTSSLMLLCTLWILLLGKNKWWLVLCLLLHAELVHSPAIYWRESASPTRLAFGHR